MLKDICANCFKSLSVPSRLKIYMYLQEHNKATVTDIVNYISLKQPTVSYHLKDMQSHGLLSSKKLGKEVYYQVAKGCKNCILKNA